MISQGMNSAGASLVFQQPPVCQPPVVICPAQMGSGFCEARPELGQEALKGDGTKVTERAQNADFRRKPQIFADFHPFSWKLKHLEGAGNRRKPQIFAANRRKTQIGLRHLRCVTFSSAPGLGQENRHA